MANSLYDPRRNPDWAPANKRPAKDRLRAIRLYREGLPLETIAFRIGVTRSTIEKWLREAGTTRDRAYSPEQYAETVRLRMKEGLTNVQIAERTGIPHGTVTRWMGPTPERLGGRRRYPVGYPERARYLRGCGYTVTQIADELNAPRSTVGGWVVGLPCDL